MQSPSDLYTYVTIMRCFTLNVFISLSLIAPNRAQEIAIVNWLAITHVRKPTKWESKKFNAHTSDKNISVYTFVCSKNCSWRFGEANKLLFMIN